ncbi:MAG: hypothetical protein K1X91_02025 [Bacteriodetes bacterium]|nr:hypothetical protein [Bacteroidota bacterium]
MKTFISVRKIMLFMTITFVVSGIGCSKLAKTYQEEPSCKTRVAGEFVVDVRYLQECPAIVIRDYGNYKPIQGNVVSIDSTGVTFLATEGFFKGDKKFYKKKDVVCVVDSSGKALYGTIPPRYSMSWDVLLELINVENGDETVLKFETNKKFDYCVPAGVYKLTHISFQVGENYKDEQTLPSPLLLNIQKGKINSLGKVICDSKNKTESTFTFECKPTERKSDAGAGAMFGVIGVAIAKSMRAGDVIQHNLELIPDEKLQENMSMLTFTK